MRTQASPTPAHAPDAQSAPVPSMAIDTKSRILDAAFRCLASTGYVALIVREIAKDAGVNHALISYYFGGKDRLVIAVLDEANRHLLQRQRQMYSQPGDFAAKWRQSRRFYEDDIASGFVRVQAELYAASLSNAELREQFLPRIQAWKLIVLEAVRDAQQSHRPQLPPAFSADAIASLVLEFWLGMEFARLIGGEEERARYEQALDAIEQMLVALEVMPAVAAKATAKAPRAAGRQSRTRAFEMADHDLPARFRGTAVLAAACCKHLWLRCGTYGLRAKTFFNNALPVFTGSALIFFSSSPIIRNRPFSARLVT